MKIMKLRQNAVKKPRQNAVKNEILPELLSIKTQYGLQAKRNGGLEQNAVILKQNAVKMDDPNIIMEEYIRLEEEKARKRGKVFNWETAKYGKICSLNNEIDFKISFDESDDEDYTIFFNKNSFSYKIISVNDLKTDSENDNEKVNMPSFLSPEPMVSYFDDLDFFKDFENEFPAIVYSDALTSKSDFLTEPTLSPQHIDEFDLKDETSLSKCDDEEQNVLYFNVLFSFNVIYPDDLKSNTNNDNDKIDIEKPSGDMSVIPLPNVINVDVGINTMYPGVWIRRIDFLYRFRMNATSSKTDERIDKLADQLSTLVKIVSKKVVTPAPVKAVEESCVTCGGAYSWYNCPAIDNNQASVCVTTGTYNQVNPPNRVRNQIAPPGFAPVLLPSNTHLNPKGEMKAITTRSGVAYEGPSIPINPSPKKVVERETEETTDKEQTNFQGSTAQIPPPVIPISIPEPDIPKSLPKTTPIPESDILKSLPKTYSISFTT
ncbi:hypothetical protein Tco_0859617 [Tanacetum coccineum]|uniref:Uncharacterized protein n=1 Tax=Tanacetum coccineum TaxID=301880 RepID=A0ABQ5BCL5_9ASTR